MKAKIYKNISLSAMIVQIVAAFIGLICNLLEKLTDELGTVIVIITIICLLVSIFGIVMNSITLKKGEDRESSKQGLIFSIVSTVIGIAILAFIVFLVIVLANLFSFGTI